MRRIAVALKIDLRGRRMASQTDRFYLDKDRVAACQESNGIEVQ